MSPPSSERSPLSLYDEPGRVTGWAADFVLRGVQALSSPGLARLASFIGGLAWTLRIRRRVTLANLCHAYPELPELERLRIGRAAYTNMALAALEALVSPALTPEALRVRVRIGDFERVEAALAEGKGVCVATGHFGSWELFGEVMARRGIPINAVVRPLKGAINARIVQSRLEAGLKLIHPRGALKGMLRALKRGELVVMLLDQVIAAKHGVFVPFFGRPASTTPALSAAARRTGAPLFVVMARREGEQLVVEVDGPIPFEPAENFEAEVRSHVARVTASMERFIRRAPEQWLWLHRRWKVQPPAPEAPR